MIFLNSRAAIKELMEKRSGNYACRPNIFYRWYTKGSIFVVREYVYPSNKKQFGPKSRSDLKLTLTTATTTCGDARGRAIISVSTHTFIPRYINAILTHCLY